MSRLSGEVAGVVEVVVREGWIWEMTGSGADLRWESPHRVAPSTTSSHTNRTRTSGNIKTGRLYGYDMDLGMLGDEFSPRLPLMCRLTPRQ